MLCNTRFSCNTQSARRIRKSRPFLLLGKYCINLPALNASNECLHKQIKDVMINWILIRRRNKTKDNFSLEVKGEQKEFSFQFAFLLP